MEKKKTRGSTRSQSDMAVVSCSLLSYRVTYKGRAFKQVLKVVNLRIEFSNQFKPSISDRVKVHQLTKIKVNSWREPKMKEKELEKNSASVASSKFHP